MSVTASLSTSELVIDAGAEQQCDVVIRNTGDVVDQFTVDVVGESAAWAMALPQMLNLMPGTEQVVQVVFAPPRSAEVPSGVVPFAVRVRSREDPAGSTVQEGTVEITPFTELAAQLVPPKKRGGRRARFRFEVENRGNTPVTCLVQGYHPDEENTLDVRLSHAEFDAGPGTVTTVKVTTVPARRFVKGEPRLHPFVVEVLGEGDEDPVLVDGVMIQEAALPAWLLKAALIAVAAAIALVVLWYTVLVPKISSIAIEQVAPQVEAASAAATSAAAAATTAAIAANVADPAAAAAAGIPDPRTNGGAPAAPGTGATGAGAAPATGEAGAQPGAGAGGPPPTVTDPAAGAVDFRIAADAPAVTDGAFTPFTYTSPDGGVLAISDIVLQNPRGDTGLLQIKLGDDVVLEVGLANFRDLDYHYLNPLRVPAGQPVVVAVSCTAPGAGATQCTPAVSFSARSG